MVLQSIQRESGYSHSLKTSISVSFELYIGFSVRPNSVCVPFNGLATLE